MTNSTQRRCCLVATLLLVALSNLVVTTAFLPRGHYSYSFRRDAASVITNVNSDDNRFQVSFDLPGSDVTANMNIRPILSVPSQLVQVRYRIPFDLNVEPRKNLAVVTKSGPGGEQVGDVLRYTSQWTLALPSGEGLMSSAMALTGGVKWQCTMFDVMQADQWGDVVEALVSNTNSRTDEVVLLFERALDGTPPELQ